MSNLYRTRSFSSQKRKTVVSVRFTESEYTRLILAARATGLRPASESELVREASLAWAESRLSEADQERVISIEDFWHDSKAVAVEAISELEQAKMNKYYEDSMPDEVKELLRKELARLESEQAKVVPNENESEE